MKIVKGLTAFILLPAFMFGGGFAAGTVAMDYFYPGRDFKTEDLVSQVRFDERINTDWLNSTSTRLRAEPTSPESIYVPVSQEYLDDDSFDDSIGDAALVSVLGGQTINANTVYIVQEYSRSTRELSEQIIPVPDNFIGMDHRIFSQVIADFDRYPTLSEMQRGMISCEVVSFTPARVVIRKTYDNVEEDIKPGYYLVNENGVVTVLLGDLKTVFMNTSIAFEGLPTELQQEILFTKYVEDEEALFGFLEAYSS